MWDMSSSEINNNRFDVARIDVQLKKWRERLLDLTKGNPLLGINRSRVSKLRVKDADEQALFASLVVNCDTLKMPLVKRVSKGKYPDERQDAMSLETDVQYIIEEGDIAFEASPKDLGRLLRRIYDNGRMTIEERGVTTLHLTFGQLVP